MLGANAGDIISGVKHFLPGDLWVIGEEFQKCYPVEN